MTEQQYLTLIEKIINNGSDRPDRTGVGTLSLFGEQMKFNIRDSFPLITTRKIFFKGVVEELLWFIRGSTNSKELSSKGVNIWNANGSKTFLENLGFTDREEGDLGPIYGFQWRHFGAQYIDMHQDYTKCGIDQLTNVINTIKTDPYNRRIILSSWNPIDIPKMALPPCHCFAQFYVSNGELSCQLYQRSADMGLGVPFNIASYSLLTYMIANLTQLKPGDFIHTIGDCHVYKSHVDQLKIQLSRKPLPFPSLKIKKRNFDDIDDFSFDDFILENYNFYEPLKLNLAV